MERYEGQLIRKFDSEQNGNAAAGVGVEVFREDGTTPATVYTVNAQTSEKSQPFNTNVDGRFWFYAPNGTYWLKFDSGDDPIQIYLFDPADFNIFDEIYVVDSEAEMLALTPTKTGAFAIRTDQSNMLYMLSAFPASDVNNWVPMNISAGVVSWNGESGVVTADYGNLPGLQDAVFQNALGARGTTTAGVTINIGAVNANDEVVLGDTQIPTTLHSSVPLVWDNGSSLRTMIAGASNIGNSQDGVAVYDSTVGANLRFRRMIGNGNINVESDGNGNVVITQAGEVGVRTLNGLGGDLNLVGDGGVTITPDGPNGEIVIDGSGAGGGQVQSVGGGDNITIDDTDPANPIANHDPNQDMVFNNEYSPHFVSEYLQEGNSLSILMSVAQPGMTALDESTVVFTSNSSNTALITYSWDGTDWTQIGSAFDLPNNNSPSLTTLDSSTVAFVGDADTLGAYSWNGSNWSQVGNTLSIGSSVGIYSISALDDSTIALLDSGNEEIRTYSWDGTDWTQIGNSLSTSFPSNPELSTLNSSTIVSVGSEIRTYSWDGTDWTQIGNSSSIPPLTGAPSVAALSDSVIIVYLGSEGELLEYNWDGTDWTLENSWGITGPVGSPRIVRLSLDVIALTESTNDSLTTYKFKPEAKNYVSVDGLYLQTYDGQIYLELSKQSLKFLYENISFNDVLKISEDGLQTPENVRYTFGTPGGNRAEIFYDNGLEIDYYDSTSGGFAYTFQLYQGFAQSEYGFSVSNVSSTGFSTTNLGSAVYEHPAFSFDNARSVITSVNFSGSDSGPGINFISDSAGSRKALINSDGSLVRQDEILDGSILPVFTSGTDGKAIVLGGASGTNTSKLSQLSTTGNVSAVGTSWESDGKYYIGLDGEIRSSDDGGVTWTSESSILDDFQECVASPNVLCFVGDNGEAYSSTDGSTWVSNTITPSGGGYLDIIYADGLFVAVGADASQNLAISTSPDAITWTNRSPSSIPVDSAFSSFSDGKKSVGIAKTGEAFIVVFRSTSSVECYASPDGLTWFAAGTVASTSSRLKTKALGDACTVLLDDGEFYGSTDNGNTWGPIYADQEIKQANMQDAGGYVYIFSASSPNDGSSPFYMRTSDFFEFDYFSHPYDGFSRRRFTRGNLPPLILENPGFYTNIYKVDVFKKLSVPEEFRPVLTTGTNQELRESLGTTSGLNLVDDSQAPTDLTPVLIARYRAHSDAAQTITGSANNVVFGTEIEDTANISSNGTDFPVPAGATSFSIKAQTTWEDSGTGGRRLLFVRIDDAPGQFDPFNAKEEVSGGLTTNYISSPKIDVTPGEVINVQASETVGSGADIITSTTGVATWVEIEFYA